MLRLGAPPETIVLTDHDDMCYLVALHLDPPGTWPGCVPKADIIDVQSYDKLRIGNYPRIRELWFFSASSRGALE